MTKRRTPVATDREIFRAPGIIVTVISDDAIR
jgi:hypothetical protein